MTRPTSPPPDYAELKAAALEACLFMRQQGRHDLADDLGHAMKALEALSQPRPDGDVVEALAREQFRWQMGETESTWERRPQRERKARLSQARHWYERLVAIGATAAVDASAIGWMREAAELCERATNISPEIEREDRSDGTERYVVRGVPCGFPVAKFGDHNDAALFVFAATKLRAALKQEEANHE